MEPAPQISRPPGLEATALVSVWGRTRWGGQQAEQLGPQLLGGSGALDEPIGRRRFGC